ncbi:MAG TPA: PEGA domain-containing protein [Candidatus Coprenecus pullistercoris]|nr:PEGA domain-containing protein [Candidatus Coprenecus pullistercoris]
MKRILAIFLLSLALPAICLAQDLSMTSDGTLTAVSDDLDAKVNFPVKDRNGKLCALVKVTVINELKNPLVLSVGTTLEVVRTEQRNDGEVWFYIPTEVKNLEFRCKGYEPLKMPVKTLLRPGNVYRTTITANSTGTYVETAVVTANFLKLDVQPKGAVLYIGRTKEYEISTRILTDGTFNMRLDYGKYYYRLEREFYETIEGTLEVDSDGSTRYISMTPAYSYLTINTEPSGATVSIDGKFIGTSPVNIREKIGKGPVTIRAQKDLYYPEEITFNIPGDTLRHTASLTLKPQFGTVTCTCADPEAELWIDNINMGKGTWTGSLSSSSSHYLEARRKGHLSQSINFEVKDGETATFTVGSPEPLYGTIEMTSTPAGATVTLDGQEIGTTPVILNKILIEDHRIELGKEGYIPLRDTIFLEHNQHLRLDYTLEEGVLEGWLQVSTDSDAYIFAGDSFLAKGSWEGALPEGHYVLRASKDGYNDGTVSVNIVGNGHHKAVIPSPTLKTGNLRVTSNVNGASIHLRENSSDHYIFGQSTPHMFSIAPGQYSIYLTKDGYESSGTETVYVYENQTRSIDLKLKRKPKDFYMARHFVEINYGYGIDIKDDAASTNYIGVNYGYLKSRVGLHAALGIGVEHRDFSFSIAPAVRLSGPSSNVDVQLYAGPAFRYDPMSTATDPVFKQDRWHLMGDAGLRLNFDALNNYSDVGWVSLSLGCRFSSTAVIPTAGVSLFPVACAMGDSEDGFSSHFLDLNMGYDIDGEAMMGAGYSWIKTHLGAYGSFLIGLDEAEHFSVAVGPVFRLTTDNSPVDLQLYGGPAYIRDEFGGDMGLRFGWRSKGALSWWDFSVGCQVSRNHVIPTFGLGIGLALVGALVVPAVVYGIAED